MVREFQRVIGREAREQILAVEGKLPDSIVACVGGGSNAIGIWSDFMDDKDVALIGVEAAGRGIESGKHGATIAAGKPGVLHGALSLVLEDDVGWINETHSVSAGLDYPAVGAEHAHLSETGRAKYTSITDDEALAAFAELSRAEGIIPALESAHAVAEAMKMAKAAGKPMTIVVNLSGRGDKDMEVARSILGNLDASPPPL
jgi:tryptophan synthase beta chain